MFSNLRRSGVLTLLCLATSFAFGTSLSYTMTFLSHPTGGPGGLAMADINRDGKIDMVYVHGSTLTVQFGAGNGTFSSTTHDTPIAGTEPVQMFAADVNNDGHIDLVIAEVSNQNLLVLLGNGDGTFQQAKTVPLAAAPAAMALGDIDNDGKVDVAVRECSDFSSSACDVATFLGNGDGTFTPGSVIQTAGASTEAHSLILTDLNRDGKLDIAVAELGGSTSAPTANIATFFGHGDGSFGAPHLTPVPFPLVSGDSPAAPTFVAGDFNGDAVDDIAVETGGFCGGSACGHSQMNVFLNNGSGSFVLHSHFVSSTDDSPWNWTAADLNNDLRTDLLRYNAGVMTGAIQTWENNGSGTFTSVSNPDDGYTASFVVVRDINLDGRHDLATEDWDFGDSDLTVQTSNNGTPNCAPPLSGAIHAKICAPAGTSVSSTTFTIKAAGNSPVGVKRMEIWIDGVKRGQALDDQIRRTVTLSAGSHKLTVVAVDQYHGTSKTTKTISVP